MEGLYINTKSEDLYNIRYEGGKMIASTSLRDGEISLDPESELVKSLEPLSETQADLIMERFSRHRAMIVTSRFIDNSDSD